MPLLTLADPFAYSGCVPEKFNAVESSSNIDAEYGNQGTDFTLIPREGFGWSAAVPHISRYDFPLTYIHRTQDQR